MTKYSLELWLKLTQNNTIENDYIYNLSLSMQNSENLEKIKQGGVILLQIQSKIKLIIIITPSESVT